MNGYFEQKILGLVRFALVRIPLMPGALLHCLKELYMFAKTAEFYDLVYSFKDYEAEAAKIRNLIHAKHPSAKAILDVACGTGEHARFLASDFSIDGIDLQ
jgi:hypothetical protein